LASITLTNVWKIYGKGQNEIEAVTDLSLDVRDGEFLALLGPSGCGKTSTLRMIAGLEDITRGEIYIGSRLVNNFHPSERDIAMVFETYALYQHLSVYDNIAFPLKVRGLKGGEINAVISKVAETLEIGDILKRKPTHLSDGQKQRVSIGRAIVREPSAFLMDEPISHLDLVLRSNMRREIKHLQKDIGITTVYVTHDQLEATTMADRIAVMKLGNLQQLATPQEIFESPTNTFVGSFVGEPPMNFVEVEVQKTTNGMVLKRQDFNVEMSNLAITQALQARTEPRVILGIRPMHIKACASLVEGSMPGSVYVTETLDEYNIITVEIGKQRILVETAPEFCPKPDEIVWLFFPEEKLHFFDLHTGQRICSHRRTGLKGCTNDNEYNRANCVKTINLHLREGAIWPE